jgi:succinate dehydrogenase/fumarate reductase-like Fe-S protein
MGLKAFFLLGWQFLQHLLLRLTFLYRPRGADDFRASFSPERLFPLTERERGLLPLWQSCLACGLCDAVCPELLSEIPAGRFAGPQLIASGMMGDHTQLHLVTAHTQALARCQGCSDCEEICPAEIPLRDLATFLARLGQKS